MTTLTKNLFTLITVLVTLLIIAISTHAQARYEVQLARVENGKLKVVWTKHYSLSKAYREQARLVPKLKPGEWLIGPSHAEETSVEVREVDDNVLTVSAEGFSPTEVAAIQRALTGWNVDIIRFTWSETGEIKIRRQRIKEAALSVMNTVDGKAVSGEILVDPSITNLDALQSTLAHEFGHWLGRSDSKNKGSIMYWRTKGRNRTNGHVVATAMDLEVGP